MGPVGVVEEYTAESHKLRIDTKKQDIANLEIQMKALYEKIFELEATLTDLNSRGITDDVETVKSSLDVLYVELDALQEKAYTLFEIPEERHQKLLDIKEEILVQYNSTSRLNDVFVDHLDESVQVIIHSNDFELYKNSVLDTTESIASENFEDVAGNIDIGVKHFTTSSASASDAICVELGDIYAERFKTCARVTISFPATKESDSGFVTVGHAFDTVLSSTAGAPSTQLDVFEPGPNYNSSLKGGVGVIPLNAPASKDNLLVDYYWQRQVIGHVTYGIYNGSTVHDSAFVDLNSGKTVDAEITLWRDREYDIISYESTASQSVGNYVYKSGATTGVTSGYIISKGNTDGIYTSYHECDGDSGSPVGQYRSGFKIFGIHAGQAIGDDTVFLQAACSDADKYAKYIPYDTIVTDIGITGITQ